MIKYEIIETIAVLNRTECKKCKNYTVTKEINLISYDDAEPVYDVRKWKILPDGTREMFRGITLNSDEIKGLMKVMSERKIV